jgi:hypothetical protein
MLSIYLWELIHMGMAEVQADDDSAEREVTWLATGLTVAQVEAHLEGTGLGGPVHVMG